MRRSFPRYMVFFILVFLSFNVFSSPSILFKNTDNAKKMPSILRNMINDIAIKNPEVNQAIVYPFQDHYVIYLLSAKSWRVSKIRVDLDSAGAVKSLIPSYQETADELQNFKNDHAVCPDNNVEFVAMSAFSDVGHVKQAVDAVYQAALKRYHAIEILGPTATGQAYENWLACPNLKGFYSIGPGDNYELIVGNGDVVTYNYFQSDDLVRKYSKTTLILNSPFVYNFPFGSELTFGNSMSKSDFISSPGPQAYELIAGYSDLLIGPSEDASACMATKAIDGAIMDTKLLQNCIGTQNLYYKTFQISESGKIML